MAHVHFLTNRDECDGTFGSSFNDGHPSNLRFGEIEVSGDTMKTTIFPASGKSEGGSQAFSALHHWMRSGRDTLVFVHGYGTTFKSAIQTGASLFDTLRSVGRDTNIVVFSWPSDGSRLYKAYQSDREDASLSGAAMARAVLKLRDFVTSISPDTACGRQIHLLCHSMGNFVLERCVRKLTQITDRTLPRIFGEIMLVAADVDTDVFDREDALRRLPEMCRRVTVYHNDGDVALAISDVTKGNPPRLGRSGPRHPFGVPSGVVNVDCSDVVGGRVEHSYFTNGQVFADICETLAGVAEESVPGRRYVPSSNCYRIVGR